MSDLPSPAPSNSSSSEKGETKSEREFTSILIKLFRDHPVLWNVKHKEYFNRVKKSTAWDKVLTELNLFRPNYTLEDLKKKVNSLRSNFNREQRLLEWKRSSGNEDEPEPSLWYYYDFLFIKDQAENGSDTSESLKDLPRATQHPRKKHKTHNTVKSDMFNTQAEVSTTELSETDECDTTGQYVAHKLRRMSESQKTLAECLIQQVLIKGVKNRLGEMTGLVDRVVCEPQF